MSDDLSLANLEKFDNSDEQLENINVQELEETLWETELELALVTKCDYGTIRNIAKCRRIPDELRPKVWQVSTNTIQ
jgi:hypothetical protein